ncbi:MAG: hypothetical protein RI885_2271 [Actinomycetota bacterium]
MSRFSMLARLMPNDPRSGHGRTVGEWLRDEKGQRVTLAEMLRDTGDDAERQERQRRDFLERMMPSINRFSNTRLGVDDVIVRGSLLCNSARDYYYSRFSLPALHEVAELIPGAPKMRMHDYRQGTPEAVTFDADVVQRNEPGKPASDSWWVQTMFYALNDDAGKTLARRIDAGLDKEVSIGWRCVGASCSTCGDDIWSCSHIPGDIYEKGISDFEFEGITNVLEDSFVFRGGQKDTTTFVPEGARSAPAAAVASAVNRFLEAMTGEVRWDRVGDMKREFLIEVDRMPLEIRAAAETYRRAAGLGVMCATPGERRNTQAVVCTRDRFQSKAAAKRWVRDHDWRADRSVDVESGWRFDQLAEKGFESFEERKVDPGVVARIGKRKEQDQRTREGARDTLAGLLATR